MNLEERVNRLERQNRRLKMAGLIALLALLSVVLMGQAETVPDVIKAKNFVLLDDKGTVRGGMGVTSHGSLIQLYDPKGTARATLGSQNGPAGTALTLYDEKGAIRATLGVEQIGVLGVKMTRSENSLVLFNADGKIVHLVP